MIVDKITGCITIDLTKPYRREIIHEALLTDFVSRAEDSQMSETPAQPTLWRILGKDDRDKLFEEWLEYVTHTRELCGQMRELALTNHDTFEWKYGHKDLIEAIEKARAEIREYVGEAPVELFTLMAEFIAEADAMLAEYGTTDQADQEDEPTVTDQLKPEQYLSVEYKAAVYRSLESYMLGLNLSENIEADLGVDEKLNADALDSLGGRFTLYARVLRSIESNHYPQDLPAFVLLGELIDDAVKDVNGALDETDALLCGARREFLSILYSGIREKLGLPKDEAREGRATSRASAILDPTSPTRR
jgi:hypothetical protein